MLTLDGISSDGPTVVLVAWSSGNMQTTVAVLAVDIHMVWFWPLLLFLHTVDRAS